MHWKLSSSTRTVKRDHQDKRSRASFLEPSISSLAPSFRQFEQEALKSCLSAKLSFWLQSKAVADCH